MNSIKLHIGIVCILAIGLLSFYMNKDDVSTYKNVYEATRQIRKSNNILVESSYYQIRELESVTYKYPHLKPMIEYSKQIQIIRREFYEKLSKIKLELSEVEHEYYTDSETGIKWNKNINYPHISKSKKEVQLIIKKFAGQLSTDYLAFDSLTTHLLKDTTGISFWQQKSLEAFQNQNIFLRNSSINILRDFKDEKTLINTLSSFDVLHSLLFFESCQQELIIMENKLINNYYDFAMSVKIPFLKPNKYAIIMSPERSPIVGEPFKADFWVTAYVDSDYLKMRVNGREILVKNGIGTYNVTPRQSGEFTYKVDISYQHPLTGKTDNYSKTFKMYVP